MLWIRAEELRTLVVALNAMRGTKHFLDVYETMRIKCKNGRPTIAVANDSLWAEAVAPIFSADWETWEVLVDAKQFTAFAQRLPASEVQLNIVHDNSLRIRSGGIDAALTGCIVGEFPPEPERGEQIGALGGDSLASISQRVAPFAGGPTLADVFGGLLLQSAGHDLHVVATDTYSLSALSMPSFDGDGMWIVPAQTFRAAARVFPDGADVYASNTHVVLSSDLISVHLRLYSAQYPDWQRAVPKGNAAQVVVDRKALMGALERAMVLSDRSKGVKASTVQLTIADNVMRVSKQAAHGGGSYDEELPCEAQHECRQAFQARYLHRALKATDNKWVSLRFNAGDASQPLLIEDGEWQCVLMPVRTYGEHNTEGAR